jgi:hypothetical protein
LVTIRPSSSSTKPDPSAPASPKIERMVTTPGDALR